MILKTSVELRLLSFKWNGPLHCGTRGRPIHTGLRISVMVLFTSYDNVVMLLFAKCTLLSLSWNLNRRIGYLCWQNEIQLFTEVIHKITSKNHFRVYNCIWSALVSSVNKFRTTSFMLKTFFFSGYLEKKDLFVKTASSWLDVSSL